ncbi:expressed protein [Phakopsora pachyrhizi]|uniref:Expressed protein n=1 Tax=Phakopsora pachyrhizi TaxID=170000 RepID=A0AAV0BTL7_PHAPC|nr:expressed protein [Phakopsora pachyrhizi]
MFCKVNLISRLKKIIFSILILTISYWIQSVLRFQLIKPNLPTNTYELRSVLNSSSTIRPDGQQPCKVLKKTFDDGQSLKFCEDIFDWRSKGLIILSCDSNRHQWNTVMGPLKDSKPRGSLYVYDYKNSFLPSNHSDTNNDDDQILIYPLILKGFPTQRDFHPLGIEIAEKANDDHEDSKSLTRMFVINHRGDRSVIEVFDLSLVNSLEGSGKYDDECDWVRTISDDLIKTPNSIVSLQRNSVLISNDHYFNRRSNPFLHILETWFALPITNVIQVEFKDQDTRPLDRGIEPPSLDELERLGVTASKVINRLSFPNGISLSPNSRTLVISSSMTQTLRFYNLKNRLGSERTTENDLWLRNFEYLGSLKLNFTPDNLVFSSDRQLIVAGHPHGLSLVRYVKDHARRPLPGSWVSIVTRTDLNDETPTTLKVQDVFRDNGSFFGTSSTALIINGSSLVHQQLQKDEKSQKAHGSHQKLVVSGLYQVGLLECELY